MTITDAIALAMQPPQPHTIKHGGHTYTISLPAHANEDTKAYYAHILTTRIDMGFISASATEGIIAGSYAWERTK